MPEITRFYGIIIKMFFREKEHEPPHIHVTYGENVGIIDLESGEMTEGDLPARAYRLVKEWFDVHKNELHDMWKSQQLQKLPPLE
jgi:hypothetical protein